MNFYFADFFEFVHMGTHGPYVWSCYAVMLCVLVVLGVLPSYRVRQLKNISRLRRSNPTTSKGSDHAPAA
jgi:heme exporter protein D